jgi:translation initiation factor 2B subunit (eIF-2B alpha/beta/delta family)
MGQYVAGANLVLCGGSRIYENGFVNKTGSLPLAILAGHFKIPFYLAAETDKILLEIDKAVRLYEENPRAIYAKRNKMIKAVNAPYEEIPFTYVSKIVNEEGIYDSGEFINWYAGR